MPALRAPALPASGIRHIHHIMGGGGGSSKQGRGIVCKLLSSQLVLELPIGHPVPSPLQNVFRRTRYHSWTPLFCCLPAKPYLTTRADLLRVAIIINAAFTPCCRCFPAQRREHHPNRTAGSRGLAELITSPRRSARTAPHSRDPRRGTSHSCAPARGAPSTHLAQPATSDCTAKLAPRLSRVTGGMKGQDKREEKRTWEC